MEFYQLKNYNINVNINYYRSLQKQIPKYEMPPKSVTFTFVNATFNKLIKLFCITGNELLSVMHVLNG